MTPAELAAEVLRVADYIGSAKTIEKILARALDEARRDAWAEAAAVATRRGAHEVAAILARNDDAQHEPEHGDDR